MNCPKCQTENSEPRKFCRECGAKLVLQCTQCGFENVPGDKFCGDCGREVKKPEEVPSVDYTQPQSYTPRFLADKILTSRSSIEGERKLVTVLFADVANYTSISEKLDPEEVHQIMDGCFKILMDEIHRCEGTINQFTGDGVMAIFGAPLAHEDHAQRACYGALAIQKALKEYSQKIESKFGFVFKMRIGINSGPVVVGAIGDDLRMDYTAIGDTTNLAARMESMAGPNSILLSGDTHRLVRDFFEFESLGKVGLKGKEEPQEAYELIGASEVETRIGASVAKGLTRFVGRKNSMAALLSVYDQFLSGSGQVVGIVGEAGVGKSRILLELMDVLPEGEFTYLEGRCFHFGGSMAYLPILDILRSYFEIKEGDPELAVKNKMESRILDLDEGLKNVLSPLDELLSLKVDDEAYLELEPKQKRERAFEAIRDLLIRESQNKPVILTVEDLHWIDKTSEEFLDYLIGWLANAPVMLILLYRPEYTHHWGSKSYYTKIGLNQLGTPSSTELVKAILKDGKVVPELMDLILGRAAGNPLFIEEFTHALMENGSIEKEDRKYVLSSKFSEIRVPDTIQGIIAARMDRLEDNLKRTIQVASVIGRDFAFRILQTIAGMHEELKSYLLHLQALELIHEKRLFPELEYIFKHALIQEVAYNSLLVKRRKEIHEEIGKAIEEVYSERLEEFYEMLAHHYSRSDESEKAYHYLKLSGRNAICTHSVVEAFRFYREAINVLNQMPETEAKKGEQIEVRLLLGVPMHILGFPEDSLQILEEGMRYSESIGDERSLSFLYGKLGSYHAIKGDPLLGQEYAENSFRKAEEIQDIELMAPIACDLCTNYVITGNFLKLVDVASKVLPMLEKTQRQRDFFGTRYNVYSGLSGHCGAAFAFLGNFDEGKAIFEKGLRFSLEIDAKYASGWIEHCYGALFIFMGDGKNAIEHLEKGIAFLEEAKAFFLLGLSSAYLGYGFYLSGNLKVGREHIEKGLEMHEDAEVMFYRSFQLCLLGIVHLEAGDLKSAQACMEEALKLARDTNEKWSEGHSRIWLGRTLGRGETSRPADAEKCILQGMDICDELKLRPFFAQGCFFLGELHADSDQEGKALENLRKAEAMFQEMRMDYWLEKTQGVLESLQQP